MLAQDVIGEKNRGNVEAIQSIDINTAIKNDPRLKDIWKIKIATAFSNGNQKIKLSIWTASRAILVASDRIFYVLTASGGRRSSITSAVRFAAASAAASLTGRKVSILERAPFIASAGCRRGWAGNLEGSRQSQVESRRECGGGPTNGSSAACDDAAPQSYARTAPS